ncbi:MAG: rod shape-determining protein [Lachnospiraceae bacterium]|nr:rod shape-determining protein [Lachnospiraceae bacterium]
MIYEPADIMIHIQGKGIVVKEKSVVAYQKSDNKIIAFGTAAYDIAGKNMEDIVVTSPLRQGIVADFTVAEKLFSYLLIKAIGKQPILKKPAVALCVPKGITPVEQKVFEDVLFLRVKELFVTELPMEEFLREYSEKLPKEYGKFKITIGITKDEPELYIKERMREILEYAGQEQIPQERVWELLQGLKGD